MAKSSTERVMAFRQRRQEEKAAKQREAEIRVRDMMGTPFSDWISKDGNFSSVELAFDMMGIKPPTFDDESNPRSFTGEVEKQFIEDGRPEDSPYFIKRGALGRAEIMVGQLLDAATELSSIINEYKRKEITDRIAEIEAGELSKPETRKQALADIVRLNKMLDQLNKPVRRIFDQWEIRE